jgi:hypothetical protein
MRNIMYNWAINVIVITKSMTKLCNTHTQLQNDINKGIESVAMRNKTVNYDTFLDYISTNTMLYYHT